MVQYQTTCHTPQALGLAQADAVYNGCVVELVGDDGVLCSEYRLKQAGIGVKAARIQDGVICSVKFGYCCLELLVNVLCELWWAQRL